MPLDLAAASARHREKLGLPLGLARDTAAAGVVRLADVKMALAVRSITTERGLDPRDYTLVAYGGGGPLHAVAIARELGIPRVIIPPSPSTFSAWGMLATDLRHDLVRTVLEPLERTDAAWADVRYGEMEREIESILPAGGRGHAASRRRPPLSRPGAHRHRGGGDARRLGLAPVPLRCRPSARLRLCRAGGGGAAPEPPTRGSLSRSSGAAADIGAVEAGGRPPSRRARSTPPWPATSSSIACSRGSGSGPATPSRVPPPSRRPGTTTMLEPGDALRGRGQRLSRHRRRQGGLRWVICRSMP